MIVYRNFGKSIHGVININMLLRIIVISAFLSWQSANALEVKGLYEAEAIAFSLEKEDRDAAIHDALSVVLRRVLVGEHVFKDFVVTDVLNRADSFVKSVNYSIVENEYNTNNLARLMRIEFDDFALLRSLKKSRLGIWNEMRPKTLFWLVIEDGVDRQVFKPKAMPELHQLVQKASREQGVPLRLPFWDASELRDITFAQLNAPSLEYLLKISSRYQTVSVLAGHLVNRVWCWESKWVLIFNDAAEPWTGECGSSYEAILEGLRGTYAILARYYSAKPQPTGLDPSFR